MKRTPLELIFEAIGHLNAAVQSDHEFDENCWQARQAIDEARRALAEEEFARHEARVWGTLTWEQIQAMRGKSS